MGVPGTVLVFEGQGATVGPRRPGARPHGPAPRRGPAGHRRATSWPAPGRGASGADGDAWSASSARAWASSAPWSWPARWPRTTRSSSCACGPSCPAALLPERAWTMASMTRLPPDRAEEAAAGPGAVGRRPQRAPGLHRRGRHRRLRHLRRAPGRRRPTPTASCRWWRRTTRRRWRRWPRRWPRRGRPATCATRASGADADRPGRGPRRPTRPGPWWSTALTSPVAWARGAGGRRRALARRPLARVRAVVLAAPLRVEERPGPRLGRGVTEPRPTGRAPPRGARRVRHDRHRRRPAPGWPTGGRSWPTATDAPPVGGAPGSRP